MTLVPEVTWAQRSNAIDAEKNIIYITINCPDISSESLKLDLQPTKLSFGGTNKHDTSYAVELEFYDEIDTEHSKIRHSERGVEGVLRKKQTKAEYWPRLLKESKRVHFLKTDFDKWVDEDDQEEHEDDLYKNLGYDDNLDFSKLGGGDLSGIPRPAEGDSEDDLEDEAMPDLEDTDATKKPTDAEGETSKPVEEETSETGEEKKPLIEEIKE